MQTLLDILTGMGLAAAAGIRPFLPGLVAGALATANLTIDFDGTDLAFLEAPGWLLALVVALIVAVLLQRRLGSDRLDAGPVGAALSGIGIGIGAVLFAGALADHSDTWWPGLIGGVLCAALAQQAARNLFRRTRARLDAGAREALTVYADGASLLTALLSVLLPPVGLIAVGFSAFLLRGGKRREGEKYAGLRILR
jgi:hypothetical protein